MQNIQILAGSISSLMFILGAFNMLYKAWRTRDVKSYSIHHLTLNNVGNCIHWLYISSLPFGPIWFLHGFSTFVSATMLFWCLRDRRQANSARHNIRPLSYR